MASSDSGSSRRNVNPILHELEQPEKLSDALKADKDDCLSCRLMGSALMFGMAGYIFVSGRRSLLKRVNLVQKSKIPLAYRTMGLGTLAGAFVAMGIFRLIN